MQGYTTHLPYPKMTPLAMNGRNGRNCGKWQKALANMQQTAHKLTFILNVHNCQNWHLWLSGNDTHSCSSARCTFMFFGEVHVMILVDEVHVMILVGEMHAQACRSRINSLCRLLLEDCGSWE